MVKREAGVSLAHVAKNPKSAETSSLFLLCHVTQHEKFDTLLEY